MKVKEGVAFTEWHPAVRYALDVVDAEYRRIGHHATLTSGGDEDEQSPHKETSLHYGLPGDVRTRAADLRTRDLTAGEQQRVRERLKYRLGPDFDVVLEANHLHLEYDPED